MGDTGGGHTESTELSAEFVSVDGIHADWVHGLVHEGTVTDSQHVAAKGRVQSGASSLVRGVTTIVVSVAFPGGIDAASVGAFPFSGGIAGA